LIAGRPLADINNTGTVTSADSLAYTKWVQSAAQPAAEVLWIEGTMNPYMLSNAATYSAYLTGNVGGINSTWNSTYGQTALTPLSANTKVTATNWASLVNTLSAQGAHQATAITARTAPVTGNLVAIFNSLQTDITNTYNNRYNAYATGSQYTAWTGNSSKTTTTQGGDDNDPWTLNWTQTVTFPDTTAANYFFNAGGLIKIQFSKLSTGLQNDTFWNNFIATCGDIYLSANGTSKTIAGVAYTGTTRIGGTGGVNILATGTGYAELTSTPVTIFEKIPADYGYTSSFVRVQASVSGSVLTLTTTWFQQQRNQFAPTPISGGSAASGVTLGTAPTTLCTYFPPETTYLTNTWGTPTVASSVSGPVLIQYTYSTPGTYSYTVPSTFTGSLIVTFIASGGGGGGGSRFDGDGHGAGNGGSGGYIVNTEIDASPGQVLVIVVGGGGAGVPPATAANGSAGGYSSFGTSPGVGLVVTGGGGGAGVNGDNNPAFPGSAGSPNGVTGSNNAFWMTNRNTGGNGFNGTGQNGTGYGDGGLGGNCNGPVGEGTAGGNGIVQFQLSSY
jgi:hypothetical protein